ncbi:MAG: DUF5916 domain-containing protein, partial [Gammaproteobacteria bacterium]
MFLSRCGFVGGAVDLSKPLRTTLWAPLWLLLLITQGQAQAAGKSLSPARLTQAPLIDGHVIGEPVWEGVPAGSGFVQTDPDEGQPASQRTEVRVGYTDDTLYFGIICYDDDPKAIVISDSRRDGDLNETDSLRIVLDTYGDGQNGFVFGTNPVGIEYDGQVSKEGSGGPFANAGRQVSGAGGGFNINWDGAWEVKTRIDDDSWSAEFAIPFKTLRYAGQKVQTWGINLQRNIRRRNETAYWSPLGRQHTLFRLVDAGELQGLEVPRQRNLKIVPYVLAQGRRTGSNDSDSSADVGFDLKYSITPALTLDVTYNTDFAQVEVDEQQVNLNRFNLFFPEKRPFFLENAGLFAVGAPSLAELFFSRRIGISADGEAIPILGGARVSGRVGQTNVGFVHMQTEDLGSLVPADSFTVARVRHDLPNRSALGALVVNRQETGSFGDSNNYNRTYAVDGRWGLGEYGLINGFAAQTDTPGLGSDDYAFSIGGQYSTPTWDLRMDYTDVGEDFNPEVGFLQRAGGFRRPSIFLLRRIRPKTGPLHEIRPHIMYRGFWKPDGFHESGFLHLDAHWEFRSAAEIHTGMNFTREGVITPFEISDGIVVTPGTYDNQELQLVANTNRGAKVSVSLRTTIGGFFDGDRVSVEPTLNMRLNERFTSEFSLSHNDIELAAGSFQTNLGRLRVSYAFTPRIALQALVQYNDVADVWSSNIRFSWLQAANTGLFVVYNDLRGFNAFTGEMPDRSIFVKYSYMFDVFR